MPRVDLEEVRFRASGRWPEIINRITGIPDDYLSKKHGPCPKCGGIKPWRAFNDFQTTGGCLCNHCGKFADGFAVISWYCGVSFPASIERVAEYLGISGSGAAKTRVRPHAPGRNPAPARRKLLNGKPDRKSQTITPVPWEDIQVAIWCLKKRPINAGAIKAAGGLMARYRSQYTVIAIPVRGESSQVVNWIIYNITGAKLPAGTKEEREWIKVKNLNGNPGLAGSFSQSEKETKYGD